MEPLWKIRSGDFAGWRRDDILYNAEGRNVGFFEGDLAFALEGKYIGEIYRNDWIGKKTNIIHAIRGSRTGYAGIALTPYANRVGLAIGGWEDPDF